MGTLSPSSSSKYSQVGASTFDELSVNQSMLFSDSLMDLKNLRSQLYSAAEYFEVSYKNDDQKQIVVNTLKDYTVNAFVNTVDHLGSVSFKVNGLLDERVDEISGTEFRVSCTKQRLRTCQEYIDGEGLTQQSLVITTPKFHKHYIIPVGESMPESGRHAAAMQEELTPPLEDNDSQQFQAAVRSRIRDRKPSSRKIRAPSPSARATSLSPRAHTSSPVKLCPSSSSQRPGKSTGTDKRSVSPLPNSSPLARSGSLSVKPSLLNSSSTRRQYPPDPRKSVSTRLHAERDDHKEPEETSGKSKSFLKSLLTRRRSRKDEMLYSYLDEY